MSKSPLIEDGNVRVKTCRHGRMLYPMTDRYVAGSLDRYGEYCEGEVGVMGQALRPGQIALDVGANLGAHTLFFARAVGPRGRVMAFEPQRVIFQMLCANMALNGLKNVDCRQAAVGREAGSITVPMFDFDQANNFGALALGKWERGETVPVVTVDELDLPACHLMKVDVEGMEGEAIAGAEQTIRRFQPALYVENDRPDNSPALIQQLMDMDYRLYWHLCRLFNPQNFFGETENIFANTVCINMLALPRSRSQNISGLKEVLSPEEKSPARIPSPSSD